MKTSKIKWLGAGVALGAVTLAACSTPDTPGENGEVQLRWIMSADSQREIDIWNNLADMVHDAYPEITVNFESTPFNDYYNKLTAQAASNDLPCIAGLQAQRVPDVGSLFIDLTELFGATSDFALSDYAPSIVEGLTQDGKQLAVPYDLGPYVLYYNKDMFESAGVALPTPGWSVDEFLAAAKALTKDGKYGFVVDGTPDMWLPYVLSIGGSYIKDNQPDLTNDKVVEGFTWVTELVTKEGIAPAPPATGTNWPADQWRSGNAAMYVDGPWQLINARDNVSFTIGLATTPAFEGTSITTMSGTGFGVTESCANPEEAWKAISVIIGPEAQKYIADSGRGFPAYIPAQENWYVVASVAGAKEAIDTALGTVDPFRTTPKWNETSALLQQYGVEAFNGSLSPAEVLQTVQDQIAR